MREKLFLHYKKYFRNAKKRVVEFRPHHSNIIFFWGTVERMYRFKI
jgi:hypothetical protein